MALVNLNFTDSEKNKLSNLSMEVEVYEKRKFEINKSIADIGELLNFAAASKNPMVMRALRQFALVMCADTAHFLKILSVDVDKIKARNFQIMDESDRIAPKNARNLVQNKIKKKSTIQRMFQGFHKKIG